MSFVDRRQGVVGNLAFKAPVRVATTAAITLDGLQTIDGVALAAGDRVLVKDQASAIANGIYTADTGTWQRARDFDGSHDAAQGTQVAVVSGTTNARTQWMLSTTSPVIGTSSLTFVRATVTDAGGVLYQPTWTGARERTTRERLMDEMDLRDFATEAALQADCFAALTAAISQISVAGKINIPALVMECSEEVTIPAGKAIHLEGRVPGRTSADGSVIKFRTQGTDNGFVVRGSGSMITRMVIDGGNVMPTDTGLLVVAGNAAETRFYDLRIQGGYFNVWLKNLLRAKFLTSVFSGVTGPAVVKFNGIGDAEAVVEVGFYECLTSPKNNTSDHWLLDGLVQSVRWVSCGSTDTTSLAGQCAVKTVDTTSSAGSAGHHSWIGRGVENINAQPFRLEHGAHIELYSTYISGDGDTPGIYVGPNFGGDLVVGADVLIRGMKREAIDIWSPNGGIVGGRIVNNGSAGLSTDTYTVTDADDNGAGKVRLSCTPDSSWDAKAGDRIRVASVGGTTEANGDQTILAVAGDLSWVDIDVSFVNPYTSGGTFYLLTYQIRLRSTCNRTIVQPASVGRGEPGSIYRCDADILIESSLENRVRHLPYSTSGSAGILYLPTVAPTNCHQWEDQKRVRLFVESGATGTGYTVARPEFPNGVYAITSMALKGSVGGATVRAVARLNGGTYVESGSVNSTTSRVDTAIGTPILFRLGVDHDAIGYRVTAAGSEEDLEVDLTIVRII